jgi:predicted small secreted protein
MRFIIVLATVFALNSCNTSIGLYRDTKQAFQWTKQKIQGAGGGGDIVEDPGAPVY